MKKIGVLVVLFSVVASIGSVRADDCVHPYPCEGDWPAGLEGPFELKEVRHLAIPMSDGAALEGWVGLPDLPPGVRAPLLLTISPYVYGCSAFSVGCYDSPEQPGYWEDPGNPEGIHFSGVSPIRMIRQGFAVALVSERGTGGSGGCYSNWGERYEADIVETIDWFASQAWSNGRVGMTGISAMSRTSLIGAVEGSDALKAVIVSGLMSNEYEWYASPQGAWSNPAGITWSGIWTFEFSTWPNPGYPERMPDWAANMPSRVCENFVNERAKAVAFLEDDRDEALWAAGNRQARFGNVTAATLVLHGFQDLYGHRWQEDVMWNGLVNAPRRQVEGQWNHEWPMEPWWDFVGLEPPTHPAWWDYNFDDLFMGWLNYWVKGVGDEPEGLGTVDYMDDGGTWRRTSAWPPPEANNEALFLAGGNLGVVGEPGSRSYTTRENPADHVRALPDQLDPSMQAYERITPEAGIYRALCPDHPAGAISDGGLAYMTDVVGSPVTIAGNPHAMLQVSSDQPYGVIDLRLYDLSPEFTCDEFGRPTGVREMAYGAADLRFHSGNFVAEPVTPGEPIAVRIDLPSLAERIEAGHRVALIASSGEGTVRYYQGGQLFPTITFHGGTGPDASRVVLPVIEGTFGANLDTGYSPPRPFSPGWTPAPSP